VVGGPPKRPKRLSTGQEAAEAAGGVLKTKAKSNKRAGASSLREDQARTRRGRARSVEGQGGDTLHV